MPASTNPRAFPTFVVQGNRVLVRVIQTPVRRGSLYVPTQKLTQEAVVVGIGSDFKIPLAVGDRVIWDVFGGVKVEDLPGLSLEEEHLLFLSPQEVIAKVEPDTDPEVESA